MRENDPRKVLVKMSDPGPLVRPSGCPKPLWKHALARFGVATVLMRDDRTTPPPGFIIESQTGGKHASVIVPHFGDMGTALKEASAAMRVLVRGRLSETLGVSMHGHWAVDEVRRVVRPCMVIDGRLIVCADDDEGESREVECSLYVWRIMVLEWVTPIGVDWDIFAHQLCHRKMGYSKAMKYPPGGRSAFEESYTFPLKVEWEKENKGKEPTNN